MTFKFELVDDSIDTLPRNNDVLICQIQEMFIGSKKELAERLAPVIFGLDQETAKKVDNCVRGTEWFASLGKNAQMTPEVIAIVNFINGRPKRYKEAAMVRRKAEEVREDVAGLAKVEPSTELEVS